MSIPDRFQAFRIHNDDRGYRSGVETVSIDDMDAGEVVVKTAYSSVNYKDALAATGKGKILRRFPLVGGIDIAGTVVESKSSRYQAGDAVLMTGCGLSETRDGGYSEYQRLPAESLVPLPEGLDMRQAMAIGTAGFTAALSLHRMEINGQRPDMGPIVITGASGGVGSLAIDIFTVAGYEVHAITGKLEQFDLLRKLGARQCISRHKLYWGQRPLESATWAGAVDNVGGEMLDGLTRIIKPWGNIASCGMVGGIELHSTVMPFIIRGVNLLGINSGGCPQAIREVLWQRLASDLRPAYLNDILTAEQTLEKLPRTFEQMLAGNSLGRTVVRF